MADKKAEETAPKEDAAVKEAEGTAVPDAQPRRADTTVPGGRFVVDGALVDANGTPIKE